MRDGEDAERKWVDGTVETTEGGTRPVAWFTREAEPSTTRLEPQDPFN